MQWFFEGLGTEIISVFIGLIVGALSGYKVGVRKTIKQFQNSKDQAEQSQIGLLEYELNNQDVHDKTVRCYQIQKSGDASKQILIGGINSVK